MIFTGKLLGYTEEETAEMTPRKLLSLYQKYREEFKYRDMAYMAICQVLGVNEKPNTADDEECEIDG